MIAVKSDSLLSLNISLPIHAVEVLSFYAQSVDLSRSQVVSSIVNVMSANLHWLMHFSYIFDPSVFVANFLSNYKYSQVYLENRKSLNMKARMCSFTLNIDVMNHLIEMLEPLGFKPTRVIVAFVHATAFEFFRNRNISGITHEQVLHMIDIWMWKRLGFKMPKDRLVELCPPEAV